jgi:hypothetical protein
MRETKLSDVHETRMGWGVEDSMMIKQRTDVRKSSNKEAKITCNITSKPRDLSVNDVIGRYRFIP